jgi:hypothetical protein
MTGKKPSKSTKKSQKGAVIFVKPKAAKPKSKKKGGNRMAKKKKSRKSTRDIVPGLITSSFRVKLSGLAIYGGVIASALGYHISTGYRSSYSPLKYATEKKDYGKAMEEFLGYLSHNKYVILGGVGASAVGGRINQRIPKSPLIV